MAFESKANTQFDLAENYQIQIGIQLAHGRKLADTTTEIVLSGFINQIREKRYASPATTANIVMVRATLIARFSIRIPLANMHYTIHSLTSQNEVTQPFDVLAVLQGHVNYEYSGPPEPELYARATTYQSAFAGPNGVVAKKERKKVEMLATQTQKPGKIDRRKPRASTLSSFIQISFLILSRNQTRSFYVGHPNDGAKKTHKKKKMHMKIMAPKTKKNTKKKAIHRN